MDNSVCHNVDGSYLCPCNGGFHGDGLGNGCVGECCGVTVCLFIQPYVHTVVKGQDTLQKKNCGKENTESKNVLRKTCNKLVRVVKNLFVISQDWLQRCLPKFTC